MQQRQSEKYWKDNVRALTIVLIVLVCLFVCMGVTMPSEDTLFLVSMGIFFSCVILLPLIVYGTAELQKEKELVKKDEEAKRIAFYEECKKSGIKSCDNPKDLQKATLIAQRLGLKYTDITELFTESKQHKEETDKKEEEDRIREENKIEKEKEESTFAELIRYAKYHGREKRIAILTDRYNQLKESAEVLENFSRVVMSASQLREEESDWAVMGGIASAIAGPAAGMAVALDNQMKTEQENAKIRAQNEKNKEVFAPAIHTAYMGSLKKDMVAGEMKKQIESAKVKLVADDSTEDCFKRLEFGEPKIVVSKRGTCTVSTMVSVKAFKIFDDVPAVVDGSIIAQIYDGDNMIGTAQMVFPLNGAGRNVKLTGMALCCAKKDSSPEHEYTVKFQPGDLWAMEK